MHWVLHSTPALTVPSGQLCGPGSGAGGALVLVLTTVESSAAGNGAVLTGRGVGEGVG